MAKQETEKLPSSLQRGVVVAFDDQKGYGFIRPQGNAKGEADVFVDGRHVGHAPARGVVAKPGEHTVRFTCLKDASRSAEQKVKVPPYAEVDVEHACQ